MSDFLARIGAHKREEVLHRVATRPLDEVRDAALGAAPARDFRAALAGPAPRLIAEIKRVSPAKGALNPTLSPAHLARTYAAAGAHALSVLTDEGFFKGSDADLIEARAAVDLPVLRKDFTVSVHDVADARLIGADAVLLIAAALERSELIELHRLATELGLDALVEVLENVRDAHEGPMLVHVVTKKGKGYGPAEAAADKYHGVQRFDVVSGEQAKAEPGPPSYTGVFAKALIAEAERDPRVVAITAAMPDGTVAEQRFDLSVTD